jgi:hypothetical protein
MLAQQAETVKKLENKMDKLVMVVSRQQQQLQSQGRNNGYTQLVVYVLLAGVLHAIFAWILLRKSK